MDTEIKAPRILCIDAIPAGVAYTDLDEWVSINVVPAVNAASNVDHPGLIPYRKGYTEVAALVAGERGRGLIEDLLKSSILVCSSRAPWHNELLPVLFSMGLTRIVGVR